MISQGDVCWADLGVPSGSAPAGRKPVLVVQSDAFNQSRISTAVCVPLTSNLSRAQAPGNVLLPAASTGLAKDSVADASQIVSLDRAALSERVGKLPAAKLQLVLAGVDILLGR